MKMTKRILACLLSVLLILPTVVLAANAEGEEPPVVATWSKVEGLWNNYEWTQRVSTNWQTVDGDAVDLSADGVANPNYYLTATVTVNPVDETLTEETVVAATFDHLWVRLRTSGEAESREYNVPASEISVDGNTITLNCQLANIPTFNMDWANVTQLNFAYHMKAEYHAKDAAAVSMTVADCKIVDMTGLIPSDPGEEPDPGTGEEPAGGNYLLFNNNQTEVTSGEGHVLSANGASTYVDLRPYAGGKASIRFGVKVNQTANFEMLDPAISLDMAEEDWIKYINAGHFILNVQGSDGNTQNVDTFASDNGGISLDGGRGDLAGLNTDDFVYVTIPLPQWLIDSGSQITGFHVYIYNNFHQVTGEDTASFTATQGVTLTYKNVELLTDMEGVPTWEDLQALIDATNKTDEELAKYTDESAAAFKALIAEAQAIADFKEDASALEIVNMINRLGEATQLLVEGMPDGGSVSLFPNEVTSSEAHYMSVAQSFVTPFDLERFGMREIYEVTLMLRVNKVAEHFPAKLADMPDADWIKKVVNGSLVLWSGDNSTRVNLADVDAVNKVSCGAGQLADAAVDEYIELRFPVPEAIVDAGKISKVEFFIYNDLHTIDVDSDGTPDGTEGNEGSSGITITVADVRLAMGKEVVTDKTALVAAIEAAEAVLADTEKDYTDASKQAVQNALSAARGANDNAKATQAVIDAAVAALNDAVAALEEKQPEPPAPEVVHGDVDGVEGVTAADALLALQAATGKVDLTEEQTAAADVDGEQGVSAADALMILQFATDKIESFPVQA